jgi:hypothetical protein
METYSAQPPSKGAKGDKRYCFYMKKWEFIAMLCVTALVILLIPLIYILYACCHSCDTCSSTTTTAAPTS